LFYNNESVAILNTFRLLLELKIFDNLLFLLKRLAFHVSLNTGHAVA
jgi:hypothetical protein